MSESTKTGVVVTILATLALLLLVALGVGGCAGIKAFSRAQKRADVKNQVTITHTKIKIAQQQADITKAQNAIISAQADQRGIAAIGIRKAQDHIAATLTDRYLQWEAIQAQMKLANSPTHTQIYVPSGPQGV